MKAILLVSRMTFKDSLRNRALYGIFFLGALLFLANIIITGMFTWELGKVAVEVGLSAMSISGLIIIFFFSIQMISNEIDRKTIYLILARPVEKWQYLVGKYMGLAGIVLLSSLVLGICSLASIKLSILMSHFNVPAHFNWPTVLLGMLYLTLALLVVLAISFLCISIATHQFTALLLAMVFYFVGQNVETVKIIVQRQKGLADNILMHKAIDFVSWIVPNLEAFNLKTTAAYGLPVSLKYLGLVGLYGVSYIVVCLVLAIWVFQKRELA